MKYDYPKNKMIMKVVLPTLACIPIPLLLNNNMFKLLTKIE